MQQAHKFIAALRGPKFSKLEMAVDVTGQKKTKNSAERLLIQKTLPI